LFFTQVIYENGRPRWNDIDRRKPKNADKTCLSASTIPTWTDSGANPALRDERPSDISLVVKTCPRLPLTVIILLV
jgi:hypothetical protein